MLYLLLLLDKTSDDTKSIMNGSLGFLCDQLVGSLYQDRAGLGSRLAPGDGHDLVTWRWVIIH